MHQVIVGTAGHVDHGKTRLVKALTGIETDRLKEEQERGISIELGFAPLTLPNGQKIGIVDVPGHERFIRQMLAGVAGMDLVLLVIAADEGVMPQTREHLDIINLLQIKRGIIVITKKDLVDDEWLEIVKLEISDIIKDTPLNDAPFIAVSAVTGEGIDELKELISKVAAETPPKSALGKIRLPIDRVFSVTGFGTVVTGTLWTGTVHVGDNVEILPKGIKTKVRSLQVHGQKVEKAQAGQRVAANITGVEVNDIERGSVLAAPDFLKYTFKIDAKVQLLKSAVKNLKNLERIRLYLGTQEVLGKVRLLDREELEPGEEAFIQFFLEKPLVAARSDRFIIRTYSPMHTIAGGTVIDPLPPKHKRFDHAVIENLILKEKGDPKELLLEYLLTKRNNLVLPKEAARDLNMGEKDFNLLLNKLIEENKVLILGKNASDGIVAAEVLDGWLKEACTIISDYHEEYPLRWGISKEELRSKLFSKFDTKIFNAIIEIWINDDVIELHEQLISMPGWQPRLNDAQKEIINKLAQKIKEGNLQPENPYNILKDYSLSSDEQSEILAYLINAGIIVKGDEDVYFHKDIIAKAIEEIKKYAHEHQGITLGEARDLLQSSRKYILPLLEYMDEKRITRRVGDKRIILSGQ